MKAPRAWHQCWYDSSGLGSCESDPPSRANFRFLKAPLNTRVTPSLNLLGRYDLPFCCIIYPPFALLRSWCATSASPSWDLQTIERYKTCTTLMTLKGILIFKRYFPIFRKVSFKRFVLQRSILNKFDCRTFFHGKCNTDCFKNKNFSKNRDNLRLTYQFHYINSWTIHLKTEK